ncbi:virulence protein [Morganella morganii]|nr:virulence protein [Morganella morganii]
MPLKRTALKLDFSLLSPPEKWDKKPQLPTDNYLKQHFDTLLVQMKQSPFSFIKEAENVPDYMTLQQCGYSSRYNGFHLSNDCGDVFIRARREEPHCTGGFEGDKFHLSVHESQIAHAVTILSGALFSDDNPCDKWKVTDISQADPDSRIKRGAQITLYVRPATGEHPYNAGLLSEIRRFVTGLESRLAEGGIMPGEYPFSDIRPPHWQFTSYRNEIISGREGNEADHQRLAESAFYRLMTEQD